MLKNNISNIAKDGVILTFVRIITIIATFIQTMILVRLLTMTEYGIYSQALLVISIVTIFTGLGLSNAINYFYNKDDSDEKKNMYINIIFFITVIVGVIGASVIWIGRDLIVNFYKSDTILPILIFIILRPMFQNLISLYQPLYISLGKAKVIAIRNLVIAFLQIILIPLIFYITKNIAYIFIVQLLLDIIQVIYFASDIKKENIKIFTLNINVKLLIEILKYSLPLALALMLGNLFKEADKLLIANLLTVEDLAIYTNMSRYLPFEFIALSFTAVITPYIVRFLNSNKESAVKLWSNYLEFGYTTTWILCLGAIICAKELLLLLYSEVYITGLSIFVIYLVIEMFKFTYFGLILSATGKTKWILISSTLALILNIIMNIILFYTIGFIGPAIASLISVVTIASMQMIYSCKVLNVSIIKVLNIKQMSNVVFKLILVSIITIILKNILYMYTSNYILIFLIIYTLFVCMSVLLLKNRIKFLVVNMKG